MAPAWIDLSHEDGENRTWKASVQNISSNGAYLQLSDETIPENIPLAVSILISVTKLSELFGMDDRVLIQATGEVRRTEPDGAAIEFVGKRSFNSPSHEFVRSN